MHHVWPRDDWNTRGRVLLGFGLLIAGKVRPSDLPGPMLFPHAFPKGTERPGPVDFQVRYRRPERRPNRWVYRFRRSGFPHIRL